jgi:mycofactocin precursor
VACSSKLTLVPSGIGTSVGGRAAGRKASTRRVFHGLHGSRWAARQNGRVEGEIVTPETLTYEESTVDDVDDVEELLVEEVSIDGLCGVY